MGTAIDRGMMLDTLNTVAGTLNGIPASAWYEIARAALAVMCGPCALVQYVQAMTSNPGKEA